MKKSVLNFRFVGFLRVKRESCRSCISLFDHLGAGRHHQLKISQQLPVYSSATQRNMIFYSFLSLFRPALVSANHWGKCLALKLLSAPVASHKLCLLICAEQVKCSGFISDTGCIMWSRLRVKRMKTKEEEGQRGGDVDWGQADEVMLLTGLCVFCYCCRESHRTPGPTMFVSWFDSHPTFLKIERIQRGGDVVFGGSYKSLIVSSRPTSSYLHLQPRSLLRPLPTTFPLALCLSSGALIHPSVR